MRNIYLTDYQIKKLNKINDNKDLYCGTRGACYKYRKGVLKIFYDLSCRNIESIYKNIQKESPIVLYPKKKLYRISLTKVPFTPYGYYMDKAPGKNLLQLRNEILCDKSDLEFDDLLKIYYDDFLPVLKEEKDEFVDLKLEHIFLDDNFYIVDTDAFKQRTYAYDYNLEHFNEVLDDMIESMTPQTEEKQYIDYNDESYLDNKIKYLKKQTSNNINSFRQLNNYFKEH